MKPDCAASHCTHTFTNGSQRDSNVRDVPMSDRACRLIKDEWHSMLVHRRQGRPAHMPALDTNTQGQYSWRLSGRSNHGDAERALIIHSCDSIQNSPRCVDTGSRSGTITNDGASSTHTDNHPYRRRDDRWVHHSATVMPHQCHHRIQGPTSSGDGF